MKTSTFINLSITICCLLIISLIFIGPVYVKKRYTELTGIEVSYWDAFFVELDTSKHVVKVEENTKWNTPLGQINITKQKTNTE